MEFYRFGYLLEKDNYCDYEKYVFLLIFLYCYYL